MGLDAASLGIPKRSCLKHSDCKHFLVFENGRFAYLSVPHELTTSKDTELCFTDHRKDGAISEMCCRQESDHVHAHVHRGEIMEDVLLEQCMEEAGCTLPMLRELTGMCQPVLPLEDVDHKHMEGCGHSQIAHGDHLDWVIPLSDGSYMLSHSQNQNGLSSFIEHGRLVKVGETLGYLKRCSKQLVPLFSYESPKRNGYESLVQTDDDLTVRDANVVKGVELQLDESCTIVPSSMLGRNVFQEEMKVDIPGNFKGPGLGKTTFDVMGICCPNEVPLIKKILEPLPGVEEVSVNVTSKTVTVLHDQLLVTDIQIVKVLNEAHMDASIHERGAVKAGRKWPSPWTIGSGVLLAIAFFQYLYHPMRWVALGAVAVGLPPLVLRAVTALRRFVLDINILMLIAVGGAIGLGDYLEAGSIVFLFTLADWLESRSSDKARAAIADVVDRAPQSAVLANSGMRVRVEDVEVGTLLSVKAGEMVPIDGEVTSGKSFVDESSLTGESIPVEKEAGTIVWAGTMNMSGYLTMKTTALSIDSAVARMVRLVEEAQAQRSSTEMLVEKIAKYYTPAIVLAALVIGVVPWAVGVHNHRHWLYLALVLLVVACPCALVISTPVVTTCGIAQAARLGLLVKGGSYLEILGRLKVVALDKTGTLSEGHFRVSDVLAIDGTSTVQQILYWITSVENNASHPLAAALVSYARLNGVEPSENVADFEIIAGEGVVGVVDGRTIHIGNVRMAARLGWQTAAGLEIMETWSGQGATVGWIGVDGRAVGIYSVSDQLRVEAVEAVRDLKKLGIRVAMLTGDAAAAAAHAHKKIGDIDIHAQLLPEDKVRIVRDLKENGVTAMVGDGINDAPALAAADVGIAMGVAGSGVAMETADVALMTNDLRKLGAAIRLGRSCRFKIGQNVTLSFVTKLVIIGLAAGGYASLWAAVVADVGTCLAVIFNSMRLLKSKKRANQEDCCSTLKTSQKKHTHRKSAKGCCQKDEGDMQCLEKGVEVSDEVTPVVTQKHKGRFPWSHHHHHHHHQQKKEKCEKDACCTKTNLESKEDPSPCCSSARCEQKVLTSRGRGHRVSNHHENIVTSSDCCSNGGFDIKLKVLPGGCSSGATRNPLTGGVCCGDLTQLQGVTVHDGLSSVENLYDVGDCAENDIGVPRCCEKSKNGKSARRRSMAKDTFSAAEVDVSVDRPEELCLRECTDLSGKNINVVFKQEGLTTDSELCVKQCCSNTSTVEPKSANCESSFECCVMQSPNVLVLGSFSPERVAGCCSERLCMDSASGGNVKAAASLTATKCCTKRICKSDHDSGTMLSKNPTVTETPATDGSATLGGETLPTSTSTVPRPSVGMCCDNQADCQSCVAPLAWPAEDGVR